MANPHHGDLELVRDKRKLHLSHKSNERAYESQGITVNLSHRAPNFKEIKLKIFSFVSFFLDLGELLSRANNWGSGGGRSPNFYRHF